MVLKSRWRPVVAAGVWMTVAGGWACTTGIAPGTAYEAPMFQFQGHLDPRGGLRAGTHPIVGVIWSDPLQRFPDVVMPPRSIGATPSGPSYDDLTIQIFRPPPSAAVFDISPTRGVRLDLALGELVIVDDGDGDGTFHVGGPRAEILAPDEYLAGTDQVLTYLPKSLPTGAPTVPVASAGTIGYQLVDYQCDGRLSRGPIARVNANFPLQPSRFLPEIRSCMRTHSP